MTSQAPGHKKIFDQLGPGPKGWARVVGPSGPSVARKFYNWKGIAMATRGRIKHRAQRVDDWASQTAVSGSRELVVPSPVPSSGHEDEERVSTDSNESDSDASDCSSGDSGTGGLNDKDTFTDDQQSEEDDERSLEEEEEEEEEEDEGEECEEMSEESETELEVAAGGYPGFKDNSKKSNTKPSPSSASNASTGSRKKLTWDFIRAVDLR